MNNFSLNSSSTDLSLLITTVYRVFFHFDGFTPYFAWIVKIILSRLNRNHRTTNTSLIMKTFLPIEKTKVLG